MATKGIVDGTVVKAGLDLSGEPLEVVACEDDVHEVASMELHRAVRDVLRQLGVEGRFYRPKSGEIGIIGDPDFSWLHVDTGNPKLVVRKSLESPTTLFVNDVCFRWNIGQSGLRISWIYLQALKQSTMTVTP
jgi:hypothetical protein